MPPSSLTLNYDAVLSTTLFNLHKQGVIEDQISTSNAVLFMIMKKNENYKGTASGDRMQVNLMYELGQADSYNGYDILDTTPKDGISSVFFDWAQASVPVAISGLEERKNRESETRIQNLLEAKTKQALLGLQEFWNKGLLQGNRTTAITTKYTSPINGSTFIDPLPLLVKYDPTTSTVIGNINQSTYSWWRNQRHTGAAATFAAFLKDLDHLYNDCSKGPGGSPDLHIADQRTVEFYTSALRSQNQFTQYNTADIPFTNVLFKGKPLTWDEFVPNAGGDTVTQSATQGTWYMLNTQYFECQYFPDVNFTPTAFIKPENQDAKVAQIMWNGGIGVSNRRKHGVMGLINTTVTS